MSEKTTQEEALYVRKSSGLTKPFGSFEAFSIAMASLGLAPVFAVFFAVLYILPGTNFLIATIIGGVFGIFVTAIYIYLSTKMPRSGGEYVYSSRNLGVFWGILAGLSRLVVTAIYGMSAVWFVSLSLAPTLSTTGFLLKNNTLIRLATEISTPINTIITGELVLVIFAVLFIVLKPKTNFRILEGLVILQIAGILTTIITLFVMGPVRFRNEFNLLGSSLGLGENYYQTVLSAGIKNGFVSGFNLYQTVLYSFFVFAFFNIWIVAPSYIAGEFTRSTKTITRGTWAADGTAVGLALLLILSFMYAVNMNFLNASVGLASTGNPAWKISYIFPGLTSYPLLASRGNIFAIVLLDAGSISWYLIWIVLDFYIFSRYFLAMSIDRLLPKFVANITKRTSSPYVGVIALTVISMIIVPVYEYTQMSFYGPLLYLGFVMPIITILLSSISGAILAYRNKDFKMTVVGILSALISISALMILSLLPTIGVAAGTLPSLVSIVILVALIIGSAIWYLSLRWYYKKKYGIDLRMIFKSLPPE